VPCQYYLSFIVHISEFLTVSIDETLTVNMSREYKNWVLGITKKEIMINMSQ